MASRWIHSPRLHSPMSGEERRVGWLELFYDLVYVASFIQLGNALSHKVGIEGFLAFAGLMVPLWLTWTSFTFYSNRYVIDDAPHRALVFLQMFAVGGMAISVPQALEGSHVPFAICYSAARLVMVALYARMWVQEPESKDLSQRYVVFFALGAACWLISIFVPAPWTYGLWAVGLGFEFGASLSRPSIELAARFPPDSLHMTERYGLLTIIVLGESFVKVLTELASVGYAEGRWAMGAMGLLITCMLWWLYFDDVAGSRIKRKRLAGFFWVFLHLPLTIAITAVGVSIKKVVLLPPDAVGKYTDLAGELVKPDKYRLLLVATLVLVLLSVAAIDAVTERRAAHMSDAARIKARLITALVIAGLGFVGTFLPVWAFLMSVTAVLFVQVLFDISMAPEVIDAHAEAHHESRAVYIDPEKVHKPAAPTGPKRWDLSDVVRRGAPNELRRDLYFHFMEGSWMQILVTFLVFFVVSNGAFAALYLADPGGVDNLGLGDFLRAFSFSVQTMASVGYGTMSPESEWAHVVSMIEAAVGLAAVAVSTGLVFAKASRPRSSVLFSQVAVVNEHNGVPTLKFRCANARGNEVVDATITVSALIDEVTPEGHRMRKLYDLALVRNTSPLFTMSWTVMHPLTEGSCLADLTAEEMSERLYALVVNMTGHDATYASTTHARTLYYPEDVRYGHRFVDVIGDMPDGRLFIDLEPFHDTVPVDVPEGEAPEDADGVPDEDQELLADPDQTAPE